MPKSVKIASVVVVSLLLVAVVVLLYQQSVKPRSAGPSTATPSKPVAAVKPTPYTPSTDITTERLPGTDSIDPNATPETNVPHSPSGPLAIQADASGAIAAPAPTTQQASTLPPEPVAPTTAPVTTAPSTPPTALIIATPTTVPAKPAPPATAPAPEPLRTYTVKSGDTLTSIAQKNLGSESRWHEIAEANPMIDPIKLRIGQVLKMPVPPAADAYGVKAATQPRDSSGRIIYIVRPLDSLATIAKQYYGTRDLWKVIYSANRGSIGSDPDKLEPGTKLVIPPAPQPAR